MTDKSPEIEFLLKECEAAYGAPVRSSRDFAVLSSRIEEKTGSILSDSTLKRIWGYMSLKPKPRLSTLDILARYSGRESWGALCKELKDSSDFISSETVRSASLHPGARVALKWLPDRRVVLCHEGEGVFVVEDGGSSKLRAGDRMEVKEFAKGHPLYVSGIEREGKTLPEYVAGRTAGITGIEVY